MGEKKKEKHSQDEFPVDTGPIIRAGLMLVSVFAVLCLATYLQQGPESYYFGTSFFAAIVAFVAYTQRADTFRTVVILIAGLVISLMLILLGGDSPSEAPPTEVFKTLPKSAPEGM